MDLSSHGNTQPFASKISAGVSGDHRKRAGYDSVIHYQRDLATLTAKDFIDVIRLHAEDGVDFVHCIVELHGKRLSRSKPIIGK